MTWRRTGPARLTKRGLRWFSDAAARLGAVRQPRVLFEVVNRFGFEAQRPVLLTLARRARVRLTVSISPEGSGLGPDDLENLRSLGIECIGWQSARHRRFDLIIVTDRPVVHSWRSTARLLIHHGSSYVNNPDPWQYRRLAEGTVDFLLLLHRGELSRVREVAGKAMSGRVRVVGQPKLDRLIRCVRTHSEKGSGWDLDPQKPVLFVGSHWTPTSLFRTCGDEVLSYLRTRTDLNILVSGHDHLWSYPSHWSAGIDWRTRLAWMDAEPHMYRVQGASELWNAMLAADVGLADHSSVTLELAVLERPLLVYRNPGRHLAAPWLDDLLASSTRVFHQVHELPDLLDDAFAGEVRDLAKRRELIDRSFAYPGCATERAADAIEEVLRYGVLADEGGAGTNA